MKRLLITGLLILLFVSMTAAVQSQSYPETSKVTVDRWGTYPAYTYKVVISDGAVTDVSTHPGTTAAQTIWFKTSDRTFEKSNKALGTFAALNYYRAVKFQWSRERTSVYFDLLLPRNKKKIFLAYAGSGKAGKARRGYPVTIHSGNPKAPSSFSETKATAGTNVDAKPSTKIFDEAILNGITYTLKEDGDKLCIATIRTTDATINGQTFRASATMNPVIPQPLEANPVPKDQRPSEGCVQKILVTIGRRPASYVFFPHKVEGTLNNDHKLTLTFTKAYGKTSEESKNPIRTITYADPELWTPVIAAAINLKKAGDANPLNSMEFLYDPATKKLTLKKPEYLAVTGTDVPQNWGEECTKTFDDVKIECLAIVKWIGDGKTLSGGEGDQITLCQQQNQKQTYTVDESLKLTFKGKPAEEKTTGDKTAPVEPDPNAPGGGMFTLEQVKKGKIIAYDLKQQFNYECKAPEQTNNAGGGTASTFSSLLEKKTRDPRRKGTRPEGEFTSDIKQSGDCDEEFPEKKGSTCKKDFTFTIKGDDYPKLCILGIVKQPAANPNFLVQLDKKAARIIVDCASLAKEGGKTFKDIEFTEKYPDPKVYVHPIGDEEVQYRFYEQCIKGGNKHDDCKEFEQKIKNYDPKKGFGMQTTLFWSRNSIGEYKSGKGSHQEVVKGLKKGSSTVSSPSWFSGTSEINTADCSFAFAGGGSTVDWSAGVSVNVKLACVKALALNTLIAARTGASNSAIWSGNQLIAFGNWIAPDGKPRKGGAPKYAEQKSRALKTQIDRIKQLLDKIDGSKDNDPMMNPVQTIVQTITPGETVPLPPSTPCLELLTTSKNCERAPENHMSAFSCLLDQAQCFQRADADKDKEPIISKLKSFPADWRDGDQKTNYITNVADLNDNPYRVLQTVSKLFFTLSEEGFAYAQNIGLTAGNGQLTDQSTHFVFSENTAKTYIKSPDKLFPSIKLGAKGVSVTIPFKDDSDKRLGGITIKHPTIDFDESTKSLVMSGQVTTIVANTPSSDQVSNDLLSSPFELTMEHPPGRPMTVIEEQGAEDGGNVFLLPLEPLVDKQSGKYILNDMVLPDIMTVKHTIEMEFGINTPFIVEHTGYRGSLRFSPFLERALVTDDDMKGFFYHIPKGSLPLTMKTTMTWETPDIKYEIELYKDKRSITLNPTGLTINTRQVMTDDGIDLLLAADTSSGNGNIIGIDSKWPVYFLEIDHMIGTDLTLDKLQQSDFTVSSSHSSGEVIASDSLTGKVAGEGSSSQGGTLFVVAKPDVDSTEFFKLVRMPQQFSSEQVAKLINEALATKGHRSVAIKEMSDGVFKLVTYDDNTTPNLIPVEGESPYGEDGTRLHADCENFQGSNCGGLNPQWEYIVPAKNLAEYHKHLNFALPFKEQVYIAEVIPAGDEHVTVSLKTTSASSGSSECDGKFLPDSFKKLGLGCEYASSNRAECRDKCRDLHSVCLERLQAQDAAVKKWFVMGTQRADLDNSCAQTLCYSYLPAQCYDDCLNFGTSIPIEERQYNDNLRYSAKEIGAADIIYSNDDLNLHFCPEPIESRWAHAGNLAPAPGPAPVTWRALADAEVLNFYWREYTSCYPLQCGISRFPQYLYLPTGEGGYDTATKICREQPRKANNKDVAVYKTSDECFINAEELSPIADVTTNIRVPTDDSFATEDMTWGVELSKLSCADAKQLYNAETGVEC